VTGRLPIQGPVLVVLQQLGWYTTNYTFHNIHMLSYFRFCCQCLLRCVTLHIFLWYFDILNYYIK
jgi:hypothetical protein